MIVNVKDFGAIGDGLTDDTDAIQTAVNSLGVVGGTIFVPAGIYLITESVVLTNRMMMVGEGMGNTILKIPDNHNDRIAGIVRTSFGNSGTSYVAIRDLTLDGNRENQTAGEQYGFYCGVTPSRPESDFDIECLRVEVRSCRGYGFDPHEVTTRLVISDCIAHDNGRDGITLDGVVNCVVQGCVTYNNGRHGINAVTASRYCILSGNICYGNQSNGIVVQNRSHSIQIVGNVVVGNLRDGIYCVDVQNNLIQDNTVMENGEHGIRIVGCPFTTITGNYLHNNSQGEDNSANEITVTDNGDIGTYQSLVALNNIEVNGEKRSRSGIGETVGENSAIQDRNAFIANRIHGAATHTLDILGRNSVISGNVEFPTA